MPATRAEPQWVECYESCCAASVVHNPLHGFNFVSAGMIRGVGHIKHALVYLLGRSVLLEQALDTIGHLPCSCSTAYINWT